MPAAEEKMAVLEVLDDQSKPLGLPEVGSFLEDVKEDLDALSPHRIAGLAVSQRQLRRYLAVSGREHRS